MHGLTTSLPQAYHIAVKRGRKVTLPVFPKVELHHITETMFDIGVEEQIVSGYRIQIYNKERCVCDAIKYRNKVGMDVCAEVVNSYLALPDRNLSLLFDYADKLRVKRILEQYIALKTSIYSIATAGGLSGAVARLEARGSVGGCGC